ncbi:MAG TPA: 2-hydroxyacyl-CoA dehydratase [Rhodanobacter sp.]|nr:2-hydroxyacyl-CoA dehydratase [Rhodanobacter sp.]
MTSQKYDFRQFQEELAKLERKDERKVEPKIEPKAEKPQPSKPLGKKAAAAQRLAMAREEFQVLRKRHDLTVAEVVAFFPEEEGIAYLQQLIVAAQAKPRRTRKLAEVPTSD